MEFLPLHGPFGRWLKHHREGVLDMTQKQFATDVGCATGTIESYEQDRILPSKETAKRIAEVIGYPDGDAFVVFARQGRAYRRKHTPRTFENHVLAEVKEQVGVTIPAEDWPIYIDERFKNNQHRWGLGLKDDGTGFIVRTMLDGAYCLTLIPKHPNGSLIGGDSAIVAPEVFYLTVDIEKIEGPDDGMAGIYFEELHDQQQIVFHARNGEQEFAVGDLKQGGNEVVRIVPWQPRPDVIRVHGINKFGLLADFENFTFFINDVEVAKAKIKRILGARLDVGIGGVTLNQRVVFVYRNFILRIPPKTLG